MTPSEREKVEDDSPAGAAWLEVAADWTGLKMSCSRYSPHTQRSAHSRLQQDLTLHITLLCAF